MNLRFVGWEFSEVVVTDMVTDDGSRWKCVGTALMVIRIYAQLCRIIQTALVGTVLINCFTLHLNTHILGRTSVLVT